MKKYLKIFLVIMPSVIIFVHPKTNEIPQEAWNLLAIFIATIISLIIKLMPTGQTVLLSFTLLILTKTLTISQCFGAFSSSVVWMIFFVFLISIGIVNVKLNKRIAYFFIRRFGRSSLGLSYSLALIDLILSPLIPAAGAKSGGVILPIINSITSTFERKVTVNEVNKLREFLSISYAQIISITGAMFLTANSANPIIQNIARNFNVNVTWVDWLSYSIVPGTITLSVIPLIIFKFYSKSLSQIKMSKNIIRTQVSYPAITQKELTMLVIIIITLFLWTVGEKFGISNISATLVAVNAMLFTKIINFDDVLSNKKGWNTFFWVSIIFMFCNSLRDFGLIKYITSNIGSVIFFSSWKIFFPILCLIYFFSHYFFPSLISHVSSMYSVFLGIAININTPILLAVVVLANLSSLFSGLSHYSSISSTLLFENSRMNVLVWCKMSLLFSLFSLLIWFVSGIVWWKFLGFF